MGRSLGFWLGTQIAEKEFCLAKNNPSLAHDVAQIVSNACLAHDIGNPPFGHAGESAIGSWFVENKSTSVLSDLDDHERMDFQKFEGNAQGFRLLTKLQNSIDDGGLRLTHATLGAFTKYPSISLENDGYVGTKKYGFFKDDADSFNSIAESLGLIKRPNGGWSRHPLVFLVEAADDICYRIADLEDALKLGRVTYSEVESCFEKMLPTGHSYKPETDKDSNIGRLRAGAISNLIDATTRAYHNNESSILNGTFSESLLEITENGNAIKEAKKLTEERVFNWDRTVSAEISGAQMITQILDCCMRAIEKPELKINNMIVKIIPRYDSNMSSIKKIHTVTDFVSGMTDSYLRTIHKRLTGHGLD